jgi:hypothetical protein
MNMVETYLAALSRSLPAQDAKMRIGKMRSTLMRKVLLNGRDELRRHEIVEMYISKYGATIVEGTSDGDILMKRTDGAFLNEKAITRTGMDYAKWVRAHKHLLNDYNY